MAQYLAKTIVRPGRTYVILGRRLAAEKHGRRLVAREVEVAHWRHILVSICRLQNRGGHIALLIGATIPPLRRLVIFAM